MPGANSQGVLTRPGLEQYLEKGYYDASILLEYTSSDFAIGRFALQACNDEPVCNWYTQRAMNWKNLLIRRPVGCSLETRMARGNVMMRIGGNRHIRIISGWYLMICKG